MLFEFYFAMKNLIHFLVLFFFVFLCLCLCYVFVFKRVLNFICYPMFILFSIFILAPLDSFHIFFTTLFLCKHFFIKNSNLEKKDLDDVSSILKFLHFIGHFLEDWNVLCFILYIELEYWVILWTFCFKFKL